MLSLLVHRKAVSKNGLEHIDPVSFQVSALQSTESHSFWNLEHEGAFCLLALVRLDSRI